MAKDKSLTVYISEFVYGAIDGTVTTFAVVAAAAGAGLGTSVALVLGVANMLADGFSMGVSSFLSKKSDYDHIKKDRTALKRELNNNVVLKEQLAERMVTHYGFSGKLLDQAVDQALKNKKVVIGHLQDAKAGKVDADGKPFNVAFVTFLAFITVGSVPLLAFIFAAIDEGSSDSSVLFVSSAILTLIAFAAIGLAKGIVTETGKLRSVLETVLLGGTAAAISFIVGDLLEGLL